MENPNVVIRSASTKEKAVQFFRFAKKGQKLPADHPRNEVYYTRQHAIAPDLLLGAYDNNELIGVLLGGLETNQVLIGEFYILPKYQKQGIGRQMLRRIEANILKYGVHRVYLGADPAAEIFYLKNDYTPELFVQITGNNARTDIESLVTTFSAYTVIWTQDLENTSKVVFKTNGIDKELQEQVREQYPEANTVYLFEKDL